jgi:nitrogenase molybdenum-iron protein NifN
LLFPGLQPGIFDRRVTNPPRAVRKRPENFWSNTYAITKKLNVPLIRVGFPIHDRIGGSRLMHLGYRGTQQLFDRVANALIRQRQESSGIGYFYM